MPSIAECGEPVTYAEWAAARGITGAAACGPVDEEKLKRWAAGENPGSVEWVPEEAATDALSDDAGAEPCQEGVVGIDDSESDDNDVDICVRWPSQHQRENPATVGQFPARKRPRRGEGRAPAPWLDLGRHLRPQRPATFGHAVPQSLQGVPHNPAEPRPFADCRPRLIRAVSRAPPPTQRAWASQPP